MCNCHQRVTITNHPTDGVTLWAFTQQNELLQRRYIDYTPREAMDLFLKELHTA